mmetsp:Transcript_20185/g.29822  ORF Transcript_20185/g.29822 Transcript_20185/m.29822 type:complete len:196 (-) Transcript_20185:10-597(-)
MSTHRGGVHNRAPKHQNVTSFRHNPKSKKTASILSMPNEGLCKYCWDKVEWKKKYRKYKPLTQPSHCNECKQRTVTAAYHTICQPCATKSSVCAWCTQRKDLVQKSNFDSLLSELKQVELKAREEGLPIRKTKSLIREVQRKYTNKQNSTPIKSKGVGTKNDEKVRVKSAEKIRTRSVEDGSSVDSLFENDDVLN